MSRTVKNIAWSIASLLVGAVLYILCRPDTYIGKIFSGYQYIDVLREKIAPFAVNLHCYLPDFLWSLALGSSLYAVFLPKGNGVIVCAGTAVVAGILWELMQVCGIVTGTGDAVDVLMYLCGGLVSVIINLKEIGK